jgi:hypothetical protein
VVARSAGKLSPFYYALGYPMPFAYGQLKVDSMIKGTMMKSNITNQ